LIDTRFAAVEHVALSDGVLNLAGVVVVGLVFWRLRSFGGERRARAT